jgi:Fe2+ transport system protein B
MLIRTQRIIAGAVALLLWLLGVACLATFATRRKHVSVGFAVALVLISVSLAVGACFVS